MRGSQLNLNRGISWDSRVSRRWRGPLSVAHSKRRGNAIERFVVDVAEFEGQFEPRPREQASWAQPINPSSPLLGSPISFLASPETHPAQG